MKRILFVFVLFFSATILAYSQKLIHVNARTYDGYIFPKEFPIWGFPPNKNRYTPNMKDIEQVENIIQNNRKYICAELICKKCGNCRARRWLGKYIRQYVGYITDDAHIAIDVYFTKKGECEDEEFKEDIIPGHATNGGGNGYWRVMINLTTKKIVSISVHGEDVAEINRGSVFIQKKNECVK